MKKNLIALAVFGAFSGAALAQSNVTLYGIIDVGYQYNDPDDSGERSTKGIQSGIQSGNRWGIRGSEALSPNLNAVFTLEGGFNIDTGIMGQAAQRVRDRASNHNRKFRVCSGATQTRLFGRQAWGGLSGNWGTVVAGRIATFSSGTGSFDMFGSDRSVRDRLWRLIAGFDISSPRRLGHAARRQLGAVPVAHLGWLSSSAPAIRSMRAVPKWRAAATTSRSGSAALRLRRVRSTLR